jgi:hypothetical protein
MPAPPTTVVTHDTIRVSCSALAIIEPQPGRLLLVPSRIQSLMNRRVLVPPGGALEAADPQEIFGRFNATAEKPGSGELRLSLPKAHLGEFEAWFAARADRELTPNRELREELVQEERLLSSLADEELEAIYCGSIRTERESVRPNVAGVRTVYLHELFQVTLSGERRLELLHSLNAAGNACVLATAAELRRGHTVDGTEIAEHARLLDRNRP